ncbi:hypothetical protein O181_023529 [Austropuccinia psidii MF-1]|uniref:Uncharacterized protein n=1 Tax=Austropuccinia psidii MF-1 TaxID=1389203 RepID=A0A9Q3CGV8_9BASI|nr:hypothetical protein [Austropuccinia psidii MF-1]
MVCGHICTHTNQTIKPAVPSSIQLNKILLRAQYSFLLFIQSWIHQSESLLSLTLTIPPVQTLFIHTGSLQFKSIPLLEVLTIWTWAGKLLHIPAPLPPSGNFSPFS